MAALVIFIASLQLLSTSLALQKQESDLTQNLAPSLKDITPLGMVYDDPPQFYYDMISQTLYGTWQSTGPDSISLFGKTMNTGFAQLGTAWDIGYHYPYTDYYVVIYGQDNMRGKALWLSMNWTNFNYDETNSTFYGTQLIPDLRDYYYTYEKRCNVSVSIYAVNPSTNTTYLPSEFGYAGGNKEYGVQFQFSSPSSNCSFSFTTSVLTLSMYNSTTAIIYGVLMSFSGLFEAFIAYRLIKKFIDVGEELKTMSIWSSAMVWSWQFFVIISSAQPKTAFNIKFLESGFMMAAFLVAFFFQARVVLIATLVSKPKLFETIRESSVCTLVTWQYIILFGLYTGMSIAGAYIISVDLRWLLLPTSLHLLPQIYRILKIGPKPGKTYYHNLAFLPSKLIFVCYISFCTPNAFQFGFNISFVSVYLGLILVQVIWLIYIRKLHEMVWNWKVKQARKKINERGKIPDQESTQAKVPFLPDPKVQKEANPRTQKCGICLESLGSKSYEMKETVCKHTFHKDCLANWISVEPVCPYDGRELE